MLKFPHARLALYNELLRSGKSCAEATIETAYKLGVVPRGCLNNFSCDSNSDNCGSLAAGEALVQAAVSRRNQESGIKADPDAIWRTIMADLSKYAESIGFNHIVGEGGLECGRMAPIVLDLVLQHLANLS